MAELDVERKKKSPLGWILLALLLIALIAFLVWNNSRDADNVVVTDTTTTVPPATYDTTVATPPPATYDTARTRDTTRAVDTTRRTTP